MEESVGEKVLVQQWLQNQSCLVNIKSAAAHKKGKQSILD